MFQGDDVFKQVSVLSGGEKARLALCKMLLHKYNVLLLDEPTNHLDMRSKDVLKAALQKFDGTMLVVSHDREFLHGLTSKVMEIKDGSISVYPGDITEFLEQKKAASIREFERVRVEKVVKSKPKNAVSEKEKWVLSKKVSTLEKEIETLEGKIAAQKLESESLDFSDHAKIKSHMEKLNEMEAKLLEKMSSWEQLSDQLNAM